MKNEMHICFLSIYSQWKKSIFRAFEKCTIAFFYYDFSGLFHRETNEKISIISIKLELVNMVINQMYHKLTLFDNRSFLYTKINNTNIELILKCLEKEGSRPVYFVLHYLSQLPLWATFLDPCPLSSLS